MGAVDHAGRAAAARAWDADTFRLYLGKLARLPLPATRLRGPDPLRVSSLQAWRRHLRTHHARTFYLRALPAPLLLARSHPSARQTTRFLDTRPGRLYL